jgi:histidine triad (HIT) family protein
MSDCIFCRIVAGTIPATIVAQNEHAVAFRDLNPQAPVHVLVIPRTHLTDANEATSAEGERILGQTLRFAAEVAGHLGLAEPGYRLVINTGADGGQSVFHLHVHILGGRRMTWPPG